MKTDCEELPRKGADGARRRTQTQPGFRRVGQQDRDLRVSAYIPFDICEMACTANDEGESSYDQYQRAPGFFDICHGLYTTRQRTRCIRLFDQAHAPGKITTCNKTCAMKRSIRVNEKLEVARCISTRKGSPSTEKQCLRPCSVCQARTQELRGCDAAVAEPMSSLSLVMESAMSPLNPADSH